MLRLRTAAFITMSLALVILPAIIKDAYSHGVSGFPAGIPVGSMLDNILWLGLFVGILGFLSIVILKNRQQVLLTGDNGLASSGNLSIFSDEVIVKDNTIFTNTPSARIILLITGLAAVALYLTLIVVNFLEQSRASTPTQDPIALNYEQIIFKRTTELPEVKSFLHAHPNATIENIGGGYSFSYEKPYPDLDFVQYVALYVVINELPDKEDIRAEEQKQYGEYYYSLDFRCGPGGLDDPNKVNFSDRIWRQSDQLCESDKRAMNSTLIE